MAKSNLYTRTGDSGTTSLVGGTRVKKNSLRLDAYGTLDEFSAFLGVILSNPDCPENIRKELREVQNMLFNLGGYLACESIPVESSALDGNNEKCSSEKRHGDEPIKGFKVTKDIDKCVDEKNLPKVWGLEESDLKELEGWIDRLDELTPKVNAFVLPGGCPLSAQAHVARTVCRRAERVIFSLAETEYVDPMLLRYINRLSDYLFILARYFNHLAVVDEITWQKTEW